MSCNSQGGVKHARAGINNVDDVADIVLVVGKKEKKGPRQNTTAREASNVRQSEREVGLKYENRKICNTYLYRGLVGARQARFRSPIVLKVESSILLCSSRLLWWWFGHC
jgi:hypothetical protein